MFTEYNVLIVKTLFMDLIEKNKKNVLEKVGQTVLPDGFTDKQQSLLMLKVLSKIWPKKEIVGQPSCWGTRFKFGPVYLELYVSTQEPIIAKFNHTRVIYWQPLTRTSKPQGWHRDWLYLSSQYGVKELKNNYWEEWSNHAKRHRRKWLRDEQYEIVSTDLETFTIAYNKTNKVGAIMRKSFIKTLKLHLQEHPQDVGLYVARRKDDQQIIGGLAVIDYPDISETTHAISFIDRSGLKTSVGTGLIDYWYQVSLEKGWRFVNFGLVWKRGDPHGWRGYSKFKKQFAPNLLLYRYQFFKLVKPVRD